jgi:hypothetical protein
MAAPTAVSKRDADFIIPSSYVAYDARAHSAQRAKGVYWSMVVDIDKGGPGLDAVEAAVEAVYGPVYTLIYSSASATAEDPKWRVLMPLAAPLSGHQYAAYQNAAFDALSEAGIECDRTLARHGQPIYLPNIPADKRGGDGAPLFYQYSILDGDLLDAEAVFGAAAAEILAADAAKAEVVKSQMRRADLSSPIGWANATFKIEDLLERYGYEQKVNLYGKPSDDWKSPFSSGFSTRVYQDHWISLSYSDAERGIGRAKGTSGEETEISKYKYRFGSAFDLIAFYDFANDIQAAKAALGEMMREDQADTIAKVGAAVARMAEKTGQALPAAVETIGGPAADEEEAGFSFDDWVLLTNQASFANSRTGEVISPTAFNLAYTRFSPASITSRGVIKRASAAEHHTTVLNGRVAFDTMYMPGWPETFEYSRRQWLNSFLQASVPEASTSDAAGKLIEAHLKSLVPDDWKTVMEWMAFIVQNPGQRVRWGMVIKGCEGDGKSAIAEAMRSALGITNVRVVGPDAPFSRFNGYAEGSQLVYLEELRAVGHSRHEVATRLKPLITNDHIEIDEKNMRSKTIINTSSYLALTNYEDALPLTEGDRRYYVAFSRFEDREEVMATHTPAYFDKLFDAIRMKGGEIRRWLLDVDLSQFSPNHLPDFKGSGKLRMIANAKSDGEFAVQDIIDGDEDRAVNSEFILTSKLSRKLEDRKEMLKTSALSSVLSRMGYETVGVVKISGKAERVHIKRKSPLFFMEPELRNKVIRDRLEKPAKTLAEMSSMGSVIPFKDDGKGEE